MPVSKKTTKPKRPGGEEKKRKTPKRQQKASSASDKPRYIVAHVLDNAQRSYTSHSSGISTLRQLHHEQPDTFPSLFLPFLDSILVVFKKEPAVERLVDFVTNYATQGCDDASERDDFASDMIKYLLTRINAKDKAIRYRACQIIGHTLNQMEEEAEVSEEIFEDILTAMLIRCRDKIPAVRAKAVFAMARLQNPTDPEDDVMKEYLRILPYDSSKDVRKAVLENVGISKISLPHVIKRVRDASADVRKEALKTLRDKVDIRALTITQRNMIVKTGLQDRDAAVRDICLSLVCESWLPARGDDIIQLLGAFDSEGAPEEVQLVLEHLFRAADKGHKTLDRSSMPSPPFLLENISLEQAVYWRVLCDHARAAKQFQRLESALPDTVQFVDFLASQAVSAREGGQGALAHVSIVKELLRLALHLDLQDEVGRRSLSEFTCGLLRELHTSDSLLEPCVKLLRVVHQEEDEYVRIMLEVLADIRDPLEQSETAQEQGQELDAEADALRVQLEELQAEKEVCLETEDYEHAGRLKKAIDKVNSKLEDIEEKLMGTNGNARWSRLLAVTAELLKSTRKTLRHAGLQGLLNTTILPAISLEDGFVRDLAIQCLGLYGLLDKDVAKAHLLIFLQVINNDRNQVQLTALRCLLDFLMIFDGLLDTPTADEERKEDAASLPSMGSVISTLAGYLVSDDVPDTHRNCVVEGLVKLMLFDRFQDDSILSLLFLLYVNPQTADNTHLRQCLSVFFPAFASSSRGHARQVAAVFLNTIKAVLEAPRSSPLNKVSAYQLAQYMIHILGMAPPAGDSPVAAEQEVGQQLSRDSAVITLEESLAFELCWYLMAFEDNMTAVQARTYCQIIKVLPVATKSPLESLGATLPQALFWAIEQVKEVVNDRMAVRHLDKFTESITKLGGDLSGVSEAAAKALEETMQQETQRMQESAAASDDGNSDSEDEPAASKKRLTDASASRRSDGTRKSGTRKLRGKKSSKAQFTEEKQEQASPKASRRRARVTSSRQSKVQANKKRAKQQAILADIDDLLEDAGQTESEAEDDIETENVETPAQRSSAARVSTGSVSSMESFHSARSREVAKPKQEQTSRPKPQKPVAVADFEEEEEEVEWNDESSGTDVDESSPAPVRAPAKARSQRSAKPKPRSGTTAARKGPAAKENARKSVRSSNQAARKSNSRTTAKTQKKSSLSMFGKLPSPTLTMPLSTSRKNSRTRRRSSGKPKQYKNVLLAGGASFSGARAEATLDDESREQLRTQYLQDIDDMLSDSA